MVGVQQWAEIRRLRFVRGLSIREISRRTGLHRETIRRAITSDEPPKYSREGRGSKVDPFKAEIARLLREDPDGGHGNLPVGGHRFSPLAVAGSPRPWPSDLPTIVS